TLLSEEVARSAVPVACIAVTVRAAASVAAGKALAGLLSEQVIALANGVLQDLTRLKLKYLGVGLAVLLLVGSAGSWLLRSKKSVATRGPVYQSKPGEPFRVVWRFDDGPPDDIRLMSGQWHYRPGKPGLMRVPEATLLLPTPIPKKPIVLSIKLYGAL